MKGTTLMKKLYNPTGNDFDKKIVFGNTTNVFDLYNIKYRWAYDVIFKQMLENHWIPEKVNMSQDKIDFENLSTNEKDVFSKILSFLIYLDSIQTNNLPFILSEITASEVSICIARQIFDEALHSRSYGYIMTSIFDKFFAEKTIYAWKDYEPLKLRNERIAQNYEKYIENPNDRNNFLLSIVSNYILEGIFFYNGFIFFYNLSNQGVMQGTCSQIRYINRDEQLHCELFKNIILTIKDEYPQMFDDFIPTIYKLFQDCVNDEITFSKTIYDNKIFGINDSSIENYTYFLANKRLSAIGLDKIFPIVKNPYIGLEMIAGIESETNKNNIFMNRGISYKQSTFIKGWEEI